MNTIDDRLRKLSNIYNFQANTYSSVKSQFHNLSDEIAEHTLCLILFPDSLSVNHWRKELVSWLTKLRGYNNVKTESGLIGYGSTFAALYEGPFSDSDDLRIMINRANEHSDEKVNVNRINEAYFRTSLDAIYDDYCKFINKMMTINELKIRMNNYYLYQG